MDDKHSIRCCRNCGRRRGHLPGCRASSARPAKRACFRRIPLPVIAQPQPAERKCSSCGATYPIERFAWRSRGLHRQQICRSCQKVASNEWYRRNTDRQKARVRVNNRKYIKKARVVILERKRQPCADCQRRHPSWVMQFDHLPGTVKLFDLARAMSAHRSIGAIVAEMDKCEVVCANCHCRRTHARRMEKRRAQAAPQADDSGAEEMHGMTG